MADNLTVHRLALVVMVTKMWDSTSKNEIIVVLLLLLLCGLTRKLCYRKEDRAMRPIYHCPENFRQSLTTPTATFPHIFNGLLLR